MVAAKSAAPSSLFCTEGAKNSRDTVRFRSKLLPGTSRDFITWLSKCDELAVPGGLVQGGAFLVNN